MGIRGFAVLALLQLAHAHAATRCDPAVHPLPNAGLEEDAGTDGCPAGMARVEAFCIDRHEASLENWSPFHNPGNRKLKAQSLRSAVPQGYISGEQAARACKEAGKRLCTDAEWLRACRGAANCRYPYGDRRIPGVCNDSRRVHPAHELFPGDPNPFAKIGHPCINQLPESLSRTAERPGCVTPEGVHDLMGNLHEWTADPKGAFRGGYYVDTRINGEGCLYRTVAHGTSHWDYSTGFRCCADADPGPPR
jgi:formylglycine-generating enzyme required for sulfatase activity